jgi:hypothetical protein
VSGPAAGLARSWREEARQDRLIGAQIERDREAARAQARITAQQAADHARREHAQARAATRQQAQHVRAARRAARTAWLRGHVTDLLFVPVIVVPAVLAWTAMAGYGYHVYGPPGLALPAFSEGAMWVFAAATTLTRRHHPGRPLWHLRLGTLLFAATGAALNFAHGITTLPGAGPHGPGIGVVMAVVSVAGVTAHQLVTAGPRRSAAERGQARIARLAARRELAARRAAVRQAVADLDEHGNARLLYAPGTAALDRRHGRTRLDPAPAVPPAAPAPTAPVSAPGPGPAVHPAPGGQVHPTAPRHQTASVPGKRTRLRPVTAADAEREFTAELAAGQVPSQRAIRARLHVGQDRARQLHTCLTALAAAPAAPAPALVPVPALSAGGN